MGRRDLGRRPERGPPKGQLKRLSETGWDSSSHSSPCEASWVRVSFDWKTLNLHIHCVFSCVGQQRREEKLTVVNGGDNYESDLIFTGKKGRMEVIM